MLVGYPPFFHDTPFKIYEKILGGKIEFPKFMDSSAKDLIKRLLRKDKMKRLGNLKNGAKDVKGHKWFKGVDWKILESRTIPAPIPVQVKSKGDSRYYEKYPDSLEYEKGELAKEEDLLFKDF
jgi:serine/threonine protein kinase